MNFRQLACFVAVVEEGSFTRAARRIGITQPSLSQHIRALEADIDGPVIERLSRGITLTPAGRSLLPEARAAVRAVERGRRARALRARARGGRARDRDRALDGGRPAAALHPALARALSRRRHPAAGVPAPVAARGRRRAGHRRLRDRAAAAPHVGRAARGGRRGRSSSSSRRRATRSPRAARFGSRSSPTASGCSTTRTTGSPGSSRRSAAAPGSARAEPCAPRRPRAPRGSRRPGIGPALVPDNIVLPGIEGSVLRLDPPIIRDVAVYARTELTRTAASFVEVLRSEQRPRPRGAVTIHL